MSTERQRKSLERMTPEQRAQVASIRVANQTPERQAEMETVRKRFEDRPSRAELIRRGEIDPERGMPMGALIALHKTLAELKRIRVARGVTAVDVAKRAGIAPAAMSRLEAGKNPNPTYETLSRYAAAIGVEIAIGIVGSEVTAEGATA
jgi:DNA-binding Xre family transcriptional regulator